MGRFVISHKRAGKRPDHVHRRSREAMAKALAGPVRQWGDRLMTHQPVHDTARHVAIFEAEHQDVIQQKWHQDLLVEPQIDHYIGRIREPDTGNSLTHEHRRQLGDDRRVQVHVEDSSGRAIADVSVFLTFNDGSTQAVARTDQNGDATLSFGQQHTPQKLAVAPSQRWWPMLRSNPAAQENLVLAELPEARKSIGWWHVVNGLDSYDKSRGAGIKVGVLDSGLGKHSALAHVRNLGALVDGQAVDDLTGDPRGHGTHVCGAIGARVADERHFGGLAPGADITILRIFGEDGSAHQGDIALGLYLLGHSQGCHLVNLSLGSTECSAIVADAIQDAIEHGCLPICAVGNTHSALEYPAALPEAVAVAALGQQGWGPEGSLAANRLPDDAELIASPHYIANFNCFGDGLDVSAPGVGIIAPVPEEGWAAYSGSSMAAPQVTGALAAALAEDTSYLNLDADSTRSERAREVLQRLSQDLGIARAYQGAGKITVAS